MFLTSHDLDFRDAARAAQKDALGQPRSMEIKRALNDISTCTLVYSPHVDAAALEGDTDDALIPLEMRLTAEFADDLNPNSAKQKARFFSGYLESMTVARGPGPGLTLTYADPLVTLRERNDPKIWTGSKRPSLSEVFDDLMSHSFDRAGAGGGTKKILKSDFVDAPPELGSGLVNVNQLDLDFIRTTSAYYGFNFHFDHAHDSASELRVRFARTAFGPSGDVRPVDRTHINAFTFKAGVAGFFDRVEVEYGSGRAVATVRELASELSPSFEPKLRARDAAGFELVYNDHRPTLGSDEAQAYADGLLRRTALEHGDELRFSSSAVLSLGDLIDVRKNASYRPDLPNRVLGRYLVANVTSVCENGDAWIHHYRAVRP